MNHYSSSAYSLSGHVSISLKSPYSFFERRSPTRLLLQSLELTFEGQTEIVTPQLGYSAVRLCSFSRELVSNGPTELCDEGEDSAEPCKQGALTYVNIVLIIPGQAFGMWYLTWPSLAGFLKPFAPNILTSE
jgi:hypothetical protein